jgi:hypothetical protein
MKNQKAKFFKLWYTIFTIIGLLGLIDVVTHNIVEQTYGLTNMGYLSFGFFSLINLLFGINIASFVATCLSTIIGFSIGWLILGYFMNKKSKLIENPSDENKKKYKIAKIVIWILVIFIMLILLSLYL